MAVRLRWGRDRWGRDRWASMATREEFLAYLWTDVIDALAREQGLDNIVE